MKIRKPLLVFVTFILTFLGAYTSFKIFHYLAIKGFEAKLQQKKDTVLIKLVDGLPYKPSPQNIVHDSLPTIPRVSKGGDTSVARKPFPGRSDSNQRVFRTPPPVRAIPSDSLINAAEAAELAKPRFPWWVVALCAVIVLTGFFYVLYYTLPYFSSEMRQDLDPPELTNLLRMYAEEIESLGNPRKIKRLSNKIRFQYHYLSGKNWNTPIFQQQLVQIILLLENHKIRVDDISASTKLVMQTEKGFKEFLKNNLSMNLDDKFLHLIYALNRESFY